MSEDTPPAELTFQDIELRGRFHFQGKNYTKISVNKAHCDERRDGDGPRRFRLEQIVGPEERPERPASAPTEPAVAPLTPGQSKPQASKTEPKREPKREPKPAPKTDAKPSAVKPLKPESNLNRPELSPASPASPASDAPADPKPQG